MESNVNFICRKHLDHVSLVFFSLRQSIMYKDVHDLYTIFSKIDLKTMFVQTIY